MQRVGFAGAAFLSLFIAVSAASAATPIRASTSVTCVNDPVSALRELKTGLSAGTNYYVAGARAKGHLQGVARLRDGYAAYSHKKGIVLFETPGKGRRGSRAWVSREGNAVVQQSLAAPHGHKHVGGMQAMGGLLAVGSQGGGSAGITLYRFDRHRGRLVQMQYYDVSDTAGAAHYVGLARDRVNNRLLLLAAKDSRQRRKTHKVYLYRLNQDNELEVLGSWGRGRSQDFQSGALLADCATGKLYFAGMGARVARRRGYIKLYLIKSYGRGRLNVDKVFQKNIRSERNDCNLDAGGTLHVTSGHKLVFYCVEKRVKHSRVTVREYRAPAGSSAGDCANAVQGRVAWNYEGNSNWNPENVARLCAGAESSTQPARCFQQVMHGGVNWGGGSRWKWANALALCAGTRNAEERISCFEDQVGAGSHWRTAIRRCSERS